MPAGHTEGKNFTTNKDNNQIKKTLDINQAIIVPEFQIDNAEDFESSQKRTYKKSGGRLF